LKPRPPQGVGDAWRPWRWLLSHGEISGHARSPLTSHLVQMGSIYNVVRLRAPGHRLLSRRRVVSDRPVRARPHRTHGCGDCIGSLVLAWLAYEALCRSPLGRHVTLALVGYVFWSRSLTALPTYSAVAALTQTGR
jgi:hypothetical protein